MHLAIYFKVSLFICTETLRRRVLYSGWEGWGMTTKADACKCRCGVWGGSGEREGRERVRDECLSSDKDVCISLYRGREQTKWDRWVSRTVISVRSTADMFRTHKMCIIIIIKKKKLFDVLPCKLTLTELEFLIVVVVLLGIGWRWNKEWIHIK